jgi:hypothetical protein
MWTVHVCRPDLTRAGEADYDQLKMEPAFNDVGTWSMTINGRSDLAADLKRPGWGIEVVDDDGQGVLAGAVDRFEEDWTGEQLTLSLRGYDDNLVLRDRLVHPEPASTAPPYSTNAYDVISGTASTVMRNYVSRNAATAAIGPRKVTGLTLGTDPLAGPAIIGRGRWNNLLEFLQGLAIIGGGLGFRVARVDGTLEFQIYEPVDRSDRVTFSVGLGNLDAYKYVVERPTASYVYIGGGGEGTARTVRERSNPTEITRWQRRVEKFVDRRDTTDTAELDQEIDKSLEEGAGQVSIDATPVLDEGTTYRNDFDLGDIVSAVVGDETVTQAVVRVRIAATTDGPQTVRPVLGTSSAREHPLKIMKELRSIGQRLRRIEAR